MLVRARSAYPLTAPGPRVRVQNLIPHLDAHGVQMAFDSTLSNCEYSAISSPGSRRSKLAILARAANRLRKQADDDLSLVHRLLLLAAVPGLDPPRSIDIYDFDDALFLGSIGPTNRGGSILKREAQRWHSYVSRARLVLAGNSYLAGHARSAGARRVHVVPTCVDHERYRPAPHAEAESVVVGWIGSSSTTPYLAPVLEAVERLNRHRTGRRIELRTVGAALGEAPWLDQRRWNLATEVDEIRGFDVGVMPMPDTDWARGKCGYKLIQYFAAGVPAIASPVGVATSMVGATRGYTATTAREWSDAIEALAGDAQERREMGEDARQFVADNYSYSRWAPEIASMLKSLQA